ncbi:putative secreted protein (Por secretion system target) [Flavobacteriaceae bacterium MAR_2010_105]|nr:putative secreted protein (Por secretion system target) [Flavobacteriaceae bacterium MAR_2010_105]
MLMYKFTQINKNWYDFCCPTVFKNLTKSITGLGLLMLFLFSANTLNAQVVPCIDGNSTEWGTAQLQAEPTFEHHTDVFTGNQDDIYTSSKDFKLFGNGGQPDYNGWTLSPMQAKSDIMNAAAVVLTGISSPQGCSGTFGAYDPTHTYLFFAGDRESNNGSGYIGFWFLLNGSSPTTNANGDKIFDPPHAVGDLLILANFESGGRDAIVTVLKWVGPGNGTHGNNLSLVLQGTNAQVGQNNATQTPVPNGFVVPAGQTVYDYNEFYEGVIDLTEVFDLQDPANSQLICSATWMLETRSSKEITADLKDYVAGSFQLAPTVKVTDDVACVGDSVSLTASLHDGNDNTISNTGYTFTWSGPGSFTGQGTATITFDPVASTDAGDYSVTVTSTTKCNPDPNSGTGTLTVYDLPVVMADDASVECTNLTVQLTASPTGGTWSDVDGNVSANGLFDATGLDNGIYNVTYTYTDGNGCTNSAGAEVTVNPAPALEINCPTAVSVSCTDDINTVFSNWLAGFTTSGGGGTVTENYVVTVDGNPIAFENLTAPTNYCDGSVISITYSVSDECDQSKECSSTFTLNVITTGPDAGADDGSTVECEADATEPTPPSVNDHCGNAITPSAAVRGGTYDGCEGTITYTFTYTDCAGNSDDWVYTYTVDLTTGPDAGADDGSTVECEADATEPTPPSVNDHCGNAITPSAAVRGGTYDGCEGTITYTFTYTDCAGNSDDWVYTYTVDLTTGPDAGADDGSTVECEADATEPTPPSVNDHCGNAITPSAAVRGGTYDGCEGTITYTFTYTDCAGNSDDWVYTYTVDLTTGPDAGADDGSTVECEADATEPTPPSVNDHCGNAITPSAAIRGGTYDGCEGTITYTFTYTDCAGNSDDWVYTYTVDLTTGPDAGADDGSTVECEADATEPTPPSVNDHCGNAITPSAAVRGGTYDGCEGTITYTFTYTDCAGNSDDWVYTYTVDLTTGPDAGADDGSTVECEADATEPTPPSVNDHCGNAITPSAAVRGGTYDGCEGTITYTFTYTDCAGNSDDWVYTYTVDLTTGPDAGADDGSTVECEADATEPTPPSVNDHCGNAITPSAAVRGGTYDGCEGTITYTFTYTDCAGNSDDWVYTYTVDLTTGPDAGADDGSTVECEADATEPTPPSVNDHCGNAITPSAAIRGGTYDGCEGTITYTFTYTDCAGNSDDWVYTYTVDLTTGPDAGADDGSTVECEADATEPTPPSVNDHCGNAITPSAAVRGGTYDGCEGTITYTFTYTDCAGNSDDWVYTYTVDLTTGPDAGADDGSTVECEADATEPTPPSVNDHCGNAITPSAAVRGGTYDGCEGTITYTFTYTDCAGNSDDWVYTYTVDLTTGPDAGADDGSTVECEADATEPTPPSVNDHCGNAITPSAAVRGGTYDGCEGTITYTFTYTDCAGNSDDWVYTYTVDLTTGPDAGADDGSTVECEADATEPTPPSVNDHCGNAITPSAAVRGGTYDGCEGTITYTFTYTDCAGNSDDWVYTYTVDLTTGPDAGADDGSTVECEADATEPTPPSVNDHCGNAITPSAAVRGGTYDGCEGTITYTFTYTDCAGNSDDWVYTYTVDLTTGPDAGADDGSTVECEADATEPTPPSVNDHCGNAITPSAAVRGGTYDGCEGTITYTFTYTDCAGNSDDWVYTYTVDLTTGPDAGADDGSTVECEADATEPTPPSVNDHCGNAITPSAAVRGGTYDGCEGTITYTFTYTDCAGNSDDWVYTYTVDLTTGPDAGADDGSTVECEADATEPTPPSVNDHCGNAITPSAAVRGGTYDGCEGTITYTFTYTDCAGNSDDWVYTYTVDLTTGPDAGADDGSTVECEADATEPTPPSVNDHCGNAITPSAAIRGGTYDGCEGTITYTFTYTDCAGNSDDWVYTYTVDLTTGPDAGADDGSTVECEADATEPTPPSVNDHCGNAITPSAAVRGGTYDGCEGTITYTFTYTDCAGNSDDWVYTYTVDLTTGPDAGADDGSTVECEADATEPTPPSVNDHCGNAITPSAAVRGGTYDGCEGTITYTFTYTDCAGNSDDWVYTYTVDLTTGPDAGADDGSTVECEADATEPTPPSVNDHCGNAITPSAAVRGGTYDGCEGTITYTFTYTDCAGNSDDWVYTYTVDLTTGPDAGADDGSTVECEADATEPTPPSVNDHCGNAITPSAAVRGGTYDGCEGTITYTFTYTDCAGNSDDWVYTYTVDLTTGPDAGADDGSTVECEADATEPTPPSVNDHCGNAITPSAAVRGGTYDGCEGTITYTFTYTDCAGNSDDWVYTYTVDLTTGPDAGADDGSTVECEADATEPTPPSVNDHCGNAITPSAAVRGGTYDGCEGTITYTFTYTDCAGNSDDWVYTYTVDLTTGPDAGADDGSTVECEADATEPTPPSVNDHCGNAITPSAAVRGGTYDGCEGTITYTFTYTDCAGNSDDWVYTYTVDLTTGPDAGADDGSTVECEADATEPTPPSVNDHCGNAITPSAAVRGGTYDGCEGTITYTFTYTDCAGNSDDWVYTYTVDLTTGPDAGADDGSTVECEADATEPTPPSVNDHCGNAITPSAAVRGGTYDGCEGTITYTFTYTDCAGNSDDWVYTYTVDDTTDPIIHNVPVDGEVCNGPVPEYLDATWTDNCGEGGDLRAYPVLVGEDECIKTYEYTFTATDCAGNSTTEKVTYIREDDKFVNCETAFGVFTSNGVDVDADSRCFREDGFSRWGWTNSISPNAPGSPYTLQLYAGAGKCELSKGTNVGTATVDYSGGYITVNYNITTPGYAMNEAHVYIGCEPYPTHNGVNTVAPGQFNFNPGGLDYVYNYQVGPIEASGDIYIIVHAVVCEEVCRCSISEDNGGSAFNNTGESVECKIEPSDFGSRTVDFTAYPVPFENEVNVKYLFDYDTDVTIEVFDVKGALVKQSIDANYVRGSVGRTTIDLSKQDNQMYFVRLTTNEGTVVKKIISSSRLD